MASNKSKRIKVDRTLIITLVVLIIFFAVVFVFSKSSIQKYMLSLGKSGPIYVVAYLAISHIIPPLIATPMVIISANSYGIVNTMVYMYVSSLISAAINFYVARIFGRYLVRKMVGEKGMRDIDDFGTKFGTRFLILGRIFGYSIFEAVSYAGGLSNMSFKRFYIITALVSIIPSFTFNYLYKFVDLNSSTSAMLMTVFILSLGVGTAVIYTALYKKLHKS